MKIVKDDTFCWQCHTEEETTDNILSECEVTAEAAYRKMNVIGNSRLGVYDGKIAGLYDLEETLGSGHFAVVKLARHVFTGEKVAVKVIDKTKLDEVSKAHLFQEVRCMKLVQHPNVVRLYEVIDTQTKLYLILELGDGGDLYDYIMKHDGGLTENTARNYFKQIVRAISYCHQLHVVHRDLKPENVVFFEKLGVVKLTDFGFSNKFCPGQKLETSCGSLAYSAPEILLGDSYDAPAVDVWSLGVILYMLVCGHPPFQEANDSETLTMIMDCKYTMPPHISIECRTLIAKMLIREPDKRATLQQIAQDIWLTQRSNSCSVTGSSDNPDGAVTSDDDAQLPDYLPLVSREQVSDDDHTLIINKMVNGGVFTKEEILDALDKNEYNHITATYFLIAERKLRASRQDLLALKKRPELTSSSLHVTNPNRPRLQESTRDEEFLQQNININNNLLLLPASTSSSSSSSTSNTNSSLLSVPRIPANEGSQTGRMRKCSIVQEEEDDEEDGTTDELTLNRRGSRSEGRLNITLQDRIAENERIKKEVMATSAAVSSTVPDTVAIDGQSNTNTNVTTPDNVFEDNTKYTIASFIVGGNQSSSLLKHPGLIQTAAVTATATAAAAIQSKGLFDGLSGVTKITHDDNNARDRLGTASRQTHGHTTVNRKKNDLRSRTIAPTATATVTAAAAADAIPTNKLLTQCQKSSKLMSNEHVPKNINNNIRSNSVDHGCSASSNLTKLPNKDIIETKFLTDSSTISIPLNQSNSYITQTIIPKYKTMPSPTRSNTILPGANSCLNEIFEESIDTGSSSTISSITSPPSTTTTTTNTITLNRGRRAIPLTMTSNDQQHPSTAEHHPHFYHHNPTIHNSHNQSALTTTTSTSTTYHRRNKFHKTKTTSCSSSDASEDDDSENRKKRATKIVVDSTKPIQYSQRRDSHDDSSDSQEPSGNNNKSTAAGTSASIEMFVNSRNNQQQQQQQHDNTRQTNGSNSNNKSTTLQIMSIQSTVTQSTTIGFRRHRGRRRNGETRLRESQSLNRITEVQESEIPSAIQQINNISTNTTSTTTATTSTTTTTTNTITSSSTSPLSSIQPQPQPPQSSSSSLSSSSSSASSSSSSASSSTSLQTPSSLSIVTNYNDGIISANVCCPRMTTTGGNGCGGVGVGVACAPNQIKPKSFGARLFQGFQSSSRRMDTNQNQNQNNNNDKNNHIYSITTNCTLSNGSSAIDTTNLHRSAAGHRTTDSQLLFRNDRTNNDDRRLVDEDVEIVLGVEIAKALKVSSGTDSKCSTATKKLKLLGRYFQVHKKLCLPLPGIFQRGRLYKAQSCSSILRDKVIVNQSRNSPIHHVSDVSLCSSKC